MKKSLFSIIVAIGFFNIWTIHSYGQAVSLRQRIQYVYLQGLYPQFPNCDPTGGYAQIFHDEFAAGSLDSWFWNPTLNNANHAKGADKTEEWNSVSNIEFPQSGGFLRLKTIAAPIDTTGQSWEPDNLLFSDQLPNRRIWPFQSGAITTKFPLGHGMYVLNCKIPPGKDMWPAFWFTGTCADEIDVFEFQETQSDIQHDKKVSMSVHSELSCSPPQNISTISYIVHGATTSFHSYGIIWNDFQIIFFVDNLVKRQFYHYYEGNVTLGHLSLKEVGSCSDIKAGGTYYEDPQFTDALSRIVINSAVRKNASSAQFPKNMDLEYFSVYEPLNCQNQIIIDDQTDIIGAGLYEPYGDRTVTSGSILIQPISNISIQGPPSYPGPYFDPGDLLVLTASNEIRILPGFDSFFGSNLIAQLRPCPPNKTIENVGLDGFLNPQEYLFPADTLFMASVDSLDFESSKEWRQISTFPNPCVDRLNIEGLTQQDQIYVLDIMGRKVDILPVWNGDDLEFSTVKLAAGMYMLRIATSNGQMTVHKFVKRD